MNTIYRIFKARLVDHTGEGTLTDGSIIWEIVTDDGERIADCANEAAARKLEMALNIAVTEWVEEDVADRTANAPL